MPKKISSGLKKRLDKANQIDIQIKALERLGETQMTNAQLREFIENLGGDYDLLLPILKNGGLVRADRAENNSKRGSCYVYSLTSM